MSRRNLKYLAAAAVVVLLGACASRTESALPSPTAVETSDTAAGVVSYVAHDFTFEGPASMPAGTSDLSFLNEGEGDHMLFVMRLDKHQDWTEAQIIEYIKEHPNAQPEWAVPVGGSAPPDWDGTSDPGTTAPGETDAFWFIDFSDNQAVIEDGSFEAGTYLFACFVGDHASLGMVKKVIVT